MQRVVVLVAALLAPAGLVREAAAQAGCADAAAAPASAPDLSAYPLLFQQNGVSFYGRPPAGSPLGPAEVVLRNTNRYPVEVSYTLQLEVRGDSLPRTVAVNRHCLHIPPRQYAITSDTVSTPAQAIRIRNLTIADISSSSPSARLGGDTPPAASVKTVPAGNPAPGVAPPRVARVDTIGPVAADTAERPAVKAGSGRAPAGVVTPAGGAVAAPPYRLPATRVAGRGTPRRKPAAPPKPEARPARTPKAPVVALKRAPSQAPPRSGAAKAARSAPLLAPTPTPAPPPPSRKIDSVHPAIQPRVAAARDSARRPAATPVATVRDSATHPRVATRAPATSAPRAEPRVWTTVRAENTGVGDWGLQATYAVFSILSATVLVLAGLGLVLPIFGGVALLVVTAVGAAGRARAARRRS